jgi:hypothetical protein
METTIDNIQMKHLSYVSKQHKIIDALMHLSLAIEKGFKSQNKNKTDTITD